MAVLIIFIIGLFITSFYIDHYPSIKNISEKKITLKESRYSINVNNFIFYKFINTMFTGIAIGSYVVQYEPIKIDDFPIMGIIFAILTIPISLLYQRILTIDYFFRFLLLVELIMLIWITLFLISPYSYQIALLIYIARNITFLFGDFLGRAETLFLKKKRILSSIDVIKQIGSICGMILSVLIYKYLQDIYLISDNQTKVYYIHFILIVLQILILISVFKSFKKKTI